MAEGERAAAARAVVRVAEMAGVTEAEGMEGEGKVAEKVAEVMEEAVTAAAVTAEAAMVVEMVAAAMAAVMEAYH